MGGERRGVEERLEGEGAGVGRGGVGYYRGGRAEDKMGGKALSEMR